MKRRESREMAFLIMFEKIFNDVTVDQIIENAKEVRDFKSNSFMLALVNGVSAHQDEIDELIELKSKGWKKDRLSKVVLAVMRIALYEIIYEGDVPCSVAVNEAVEITKKYSTIDDATFVNGILRSIVREREQ